MQYYLTCFDLQNPNKMSISVDQYWKPLIIRKNQIIEVFRISDQFKCIIKVSYYHLLQKSVDFFLGQAEVWVV